MLLISVISGNNQYYSQYMVFLALVKKVNEIILKDHLHSILGGFSLKDQHVRFPPSWGTKESSHGLVGKIPKIPSLQSLLWQL